jgi:DNA mismatch endonuclease, patch repair protein
MARILAKDTQPELCVRRLVYALGYRYRLHVRTLPGTPDLVFRSRKKVIFVHGCFWHRHPGCGRLPKSRKRFWVNKLESNRRRDLANIRRLQRSGWQVLVIWECELTSRKLVDRVISFLEGCNAKVR